MRDTASSALALALTLMGCGGAEGGPAPTRCAAPHSVSGRPQTIQQAVALIDALPRPVSVACAVEALEGPLYLNATNSQVSAQPAEGDSAPRVFIMNEGLILSVTLGTTGQDLLEFGELRGDGLTIKGELVFPIDAPSIAPSRPFAHLPYDDQVTSCGLCHTPEVPADVVDGVQTFASPPFRPVDSTVVPLEQVRRLRSTCDRAAEPGRCDLLEALFDRQAVTEVAFPREFGTILGP